MNFHTPQINQVPDVEDAADALAVAICHGHSMRTQNIMAGAGVKGYSRGRLK